METLPRGAVPSDKSQKWHNKVTILIFNDYCVGLCNLGRSNGVPWQAHPLKASPREGGCGNRVEWQFERCVAGARSCRC